MRTPSPSSVNCKNSAISRLRSRSSKRTRTRSKSSAVPVVSRRFDLPRTINRSLSPPASCMTATPASTRPVVKTSNSERCFSISTIILDFNSCNVRPWPMAFKKFTASRIWLGVWPKGGRNTRFSTSPLAKTKTASARSVAKDTNSICFMGEDFFGARTKDAPRVSPDRALDIRSSMPVILSFSSIVAEILRCVALSGSPTSKIPSTNIRKPSSVGWRPAEVCGLSSRPRSSKSFMTLRMVAALTVSVICWVNVLLPIGSPEDR